MLATVQSVSRLWAAGTVLEEILSVPTRLSLECDSKRRRPASAGPSGRASISQQRPASAVLGGRRASTNHLRPTSPMAGGRAALNQQRPSSAPSGRGLCAGVNSAVVSDCGTVKSRHEKQDVGASFMKEVSKRLLDVQQKGKERRRASEVAQRGRHLSLTGEPWRNPGTCVIPAPTRTRSLSPDAPPLEVLESVAWLSDSSSVKNDRQRKREDLDCKPWRYGTALAVGRSASQSNDVSPMNSVFGDAQLMNGSVSTTRLSGFHSSSTRCNSRKEEVQALRRSRCHSVSGESWKSSGACGSTIRPACLSRTRGGTTSGLFSDVQMLTGSEWDASYMQSCGREWRPQRVVHHRRRRSKCQKKAVSSSGNSSVIHDSPTDFAEVDRRLPHERVAAEFSDCESDAEIIAETESDKMPATVKECLGGIAVTPSALNAAHGGA